MTLTLEVIKLKTSADITIWTAWQQLQTFRTELLPSFALNEFLVMSDGPEASFGAKASELRSQNWWRPSIAATASSFCGPECGAVASKLSESRQDQVRNLSGRFNK